MPQVSHAVYFTLKDRSPESIKRLIESCRAHLTGHTGEVYFSAGTLADYDRQVNDREFDVALTIVFESHEAHDAYQTAPRHETFLAENAATWAKVRVFDADV